MHLIETLIGKGYELRLYDRNVNMASLTGANRDDILNHISHIVVGRPVTHTLYIGGNDPADGWVKVFRGRGFLLEGRCCLAI